MPTNRLKAALGAAAAAGSVVLAGCAALARPGSVSPYEERSFRRVNEPVGRMERPVWLVMQFGNGLTAVGAPAAMLALRRPRSDAARAAAAAFGGWHLAKAVKVAVPRSRPAALLSGVHLRDGDPGGGGFVSGHATVAMATAVAVGASTNIPTLATLVAAALMVGAARVHVGAHLPLDVVGGAALGVVWGSACAATPLPGSVGVST